MVEEINELDTSKAAFRKTWRNVLVDKISLAANQLKLSEKEKKDKEVEDKKAKNKKHNKQRWFRQSMMEFYGVEKIIDGVDHHYYVVTGEWYLVEPSGTQMKAAHINPKVLEGEVLNRLFGAEHLLLLWDPRNCLPLLAIIEEELDNGSIVIVPDQMEGWKVLSLKVVLVNESMRNKIYFGHGELARKWDSLDGKVLRSVSEVAEAQVTLPKKTQDRLKAAEGPQRMCLATSPLNEVVISVALLHIFLPSEEWSRSLGLLPGSIDTRKQEALCGCFLGSILENK